MPTWWFVPIVGVLAHLTAGRCQVMQEVSVKVASDLEFWSEILPQRSSEDLACTHEVSNVAICNVFGLSFKLVNIIIPYV